MRIALIVALLAFSPGAWWQKVWHQSNSHAAASRGESQYATKKYDESARSFDEARKMVPSAQNAFNAGTARIAAGDPARGAAALEPALHDPRLRANALFNRGNGALAAKAWEYAIRDYSDVLRLRPADAAAKRNLEIALSKLEEMQRQNAGGRRPQQGGGGAGTPPPPNPRPGARQPPEQQPEGDAEALLRSVQQQEQEELQRMKRARSASAKVGW